MPWRDIKKFPRSSSTCTVYLLHFTQPYKHAQHYIGVTNGERDVLARHAEHVKGKGARICKQAVEAGARLVLSRVWEKVPRYTELRLKNQGGAKKHCPICRGEASVVPPSQPTVSST